ncbi:hypothetical protein [Paraburkholderia susongensis]|uniref:hypothetical protein n=1 Tax=Paraburkholderia susongensis TaxID=1515439 RepID=UPI00117D3F3C|nr:hypothetical protein [Paraburkholderia susongensis]
MMDLNAGAQAWAEQFGSAPLSAVHAVSLVGSAHATVRAAGTAAQLLDWLDADVFTHTLQQQEPGHAR